MLYGLGIITSFCQIVIGSVFVSKNIHDKDSFSLVIIGAVIILFGILIFFMSIYALANRQTLEKTNELLEHILSNGKNDNNDNSFDIDISANETTNYNKSNSIKKQLKIFS